MWTEINGGKTVTRDDKGRFIKGNKEGNGRPRGSVGLMERCRQITNDGADAVQFYSDIANGKLTNRLDWRMQAWDWLVCRGWGKAVQQTDNKTDMTVSGGLKIEIGGDSSIEPGN
jgi:hypothetical protein